MGWSVSSLIAQSRALSFRFTLNSGTVARPTLVNEIPEGGVALMTKAVAQMNAPTATIAARALAGLTNFLGVMVMFLSGLVILVSWARVADIILNFPFVHFYAHDLWDRQLLVRDAAPGACLGATGNKMQRRSKCSTRSFFPSDPAVAPEQSQCENPSH